MTGAAQSCSCRNGRELFTHSGFPPDADLSETGFIANVPEGFYDSIKWMVHRYPGTPIIITENGVESSDDEPPAAEARSAPDLRAKAPGGKEAESSAKTSRDEEKSDAGKSDSPAADDRKKSEANRIVFKKARAVWVNVKNKAEADLELVKEGARRHYLGDLTQFPKVVEGCKQIDAILDSLAAPLWIFAQAAEFLLGFGLPYAPAYSYYNSYDILDLKSGKARH